MKKVFLFLIIILSLASFTTVRAVKPNDILINEIAWMGSVSSANNEWLELKNTTSEDINLTGWKLISAGGNIKANLKGFIIANGFYLLERTDDGSVPSVPADLLYTGNLNNSGQVLTLSDPQNTIINQVNFPTKWPAGNNITKQTMEKNLAGWQSSKNAGGTPKAQNSQGVTQTSNTINNPTTNIVYPAGIIINEILPQPENNEPENEWIELYNTNSFAVDLMGWRLQDIKGSQKTYTFPKGITIDGNSYLVLKRVDTKLTLNNEGDGLNLLFPNKKITDSVSFGKTIKDQSYNKITDTWQWSKTKTPGAANIPASLLPNNQKTDNTYLSAISQPLNPNDAAGISNPWLLFLAALGITAIFTTLFLLLKFKLKKT